MDKGLLIFLIFGHVSILSYGQLQDCENLAKMMEEDTTKSIWDFDSIPSDTYYCLGHYFAKRDIENNVFLIQTYGHPDWANPCIVCRYKDFGFSFYYHFDFILENVTNFIEGYNEVSEGYLKAKIGDSAFAQLQVIPEDYFNPKEFISKNFDNMKHLSLFDVEVINDTSIQVKLKVEMLFKDYPQLQTQVVYRISDLGNTYKTEGQTQLLDDKQIKETGFRLSEKSNNTYYFKITFDFQAIVSEGNICWCELMNKTEFSYVIPLTIEL